MHHQGTVLLGRPVAGERRLAGASGIVVVVAALLVVVAVAAAVARLLCLAPSGQ